MILSWLTIVAVSVGLASAAAFRRQTVSQVSPEQVSSYASFAHFAGAAFCFPSQIQSWSCGGDLSFRSCARRTPVADCPQTLVIQGTARQILLSSHLTPGEMGSMSHTVRASIIQVIFFLLKCAQQGLWATTGTMTRPSWRTKELT